MDQIAFLVVNMNQMGQMSVPTPINIQHVPNNVLVPAAPLFPANMQIPDNSTNPNYQLPQLLNPPLQLVPGVPGIHTLPITQSHSQFRNLETSTNPQCGIGPATLIQPTSDIIKMDALPQSTLKMLHQSTPHSMNQSINHSIKQHPLRSESSHITMNGSLPSPSIRVNAVNPLAVCPNDTKSIQFTPAMFLRKTEGNEMNHLNHQRVLNVNGINVNGLTVNGTKSPNPMDSPLSNPSVSSVPSAPSLTPTKMDITKIEKIPIIPLVPPVVAGGLTAGGGLQPQCTPCHSHPVSDTKEWSNPLESGSFRCGFCGKTFQHESNLQIHLKIHSPNALQCSFCGKKFARHSNLRQHRRVHTNERPFHCSYCSKSFKQQHRYLLYLPLFGNSLNSNYLQSLFDP